VPVPAGDAGDEVGKVVAFLRHRGDNDAPLVDLHINGMSGTDRDFSGDGSRDAQREAIAPFLQNSFHVDTLTIRQRCRSGKSLEKEGPQVFLDPAGHKEFVAKGQAAFETALKKEQEAARARPATE